MNQNVSAVDQMLKDRGIVLSVEYAEKQLNRIDALMAKLEAKKAAVAIK